MVVDFKQVCNKFHENYPNIVLVRFSGNYMHLYYRDETKILRQAHVLMSNIEYLEINQYGKEN